MKTIVLFLACVIFAGAAFAQSVDDGKRFLYYERYKSAKDVFQKLSAANPSDEVAAYYLGQAMIGLEDVAGAKAMYQQKLSANSSSALLTAGMGHIALLEGNAADARSRFDAAVSMSAGKRIDVLNAVGAPNSDPEVKNGDAAYAIDKLKQATMIKGFKDPEVLANLGDAYRKLNDGANSVLSYDAAIALNANYARGYYRKGRLYQSQGSAQEPLFMGLYNTAISKDPNYAPVFFTLYNYYYETNVPLSAQYLEKGLAVSDDDPKACYLRASIKYAQGLFAEAISQADGCINAGGTNVYPNLYGVRAYAYNKLGDSLNAKKSFEEYFTKQIPSKIGGGDYATYSSVLLKFPGSEAQAASYVEKAVAMDSIEANKVNYLKALATAFRNQKNFAQSAAWFNKVLDVKKNYSNLDLYNAGYDYFRAAKFDSSIIVFKKYEAKYPDDVFGYYMEAKATAGIDTVGLLGMTAAAYEKAIEIGEKAPDQSKVKDQLVGSYNYMTQYSFNVKKDKAAAVGFNTKALAVDPTDATAVALKDFLAKNEPNTRPTTPPRPATPARPTTASPSTPKPPVTPAKPKKK